MNIVKYKKIGKNKYKIYLSNNKEIVLYEEIILKYELLLKKKIENLEDILKDNKDYEAYDLALSYINKRQRCEKEIKDYLIKKDYDQSLINKILKELKEKGIINEVMYIKSFTNDKFNINNYGPNKIINELIKLGLNKDIVLNNVQISEEDINNKLNKLIDKKILSLKKYSGNILKFKIESYFINLGYDKKYIDNVLNSKELNNLDYEEEYKKLYNKYSKKYSGYELDNIIKRKLYEKGYRDFN